MLFDPKELKRSFQEELDRRSKLIDIGALDSAKVANGHRPQFNLLEDTNERIIAICSRRAAKSVSVCAKIAKMALQYPNSTIFYFGATGPAVRVLIWEPVWQRFRKLWGIGGKDNESHMITRFSNGSTVIFTGTDDYRHVSSFLGGKLRGAFIDECQDQPLSVLGPLVITILPPALSDYKDGTPTLLMLSGTVPYVPAGLFYDIWTQPEKYQGWSRHNWNRFENPHIESVQKLAEHLKQTGLNEDDAEIQRDWHGRFVFDEKLTAYRYNKTRNSYEGVFNKELGSWTGLFPSDLEMFSVGIDPGAHDRTAIVVWGWGKNHWHVYHVYEWSTKKNSGTTLSQIAEQLSYICKTFKPVNYLFMDMGGSQVAIDTFQRDYGVPIVHAAKKVDLHGQVMRFSDLLTQHNRHGKGKCLVIEGSELENDLLRTQWDKDARAKGLWRWSSNHHPDVADGGRYGLQGYYDSFVDKKPDETLEQAAIRKQEEEWLRSLKPPVREGIYQPSDIEQLYAGLLVDISSIGRRDK